MEEAGLVGISICLGFVLLCIDALGSVWDSICAEFKRQST
jgi:hypothetical protein